MDNAFVSGLITLGWALSWPFVAFHLLLRLWSLKRKYRRFKKYPEDFLENERYKYVNTIAKACKYLRRAKIHEVIEHGIIANKAQLIICNHRSNLDPILLYNYLYDKLNNNFIFIAKKELREKSYGFVFDFIGTIYLDRQNIREAIKIIDEQKKELKNNKIVVVFPEGTRSQTEEMGELKSGALEPAYATLSAIQPLVITATEQYKEKKIPYRQRDKIKLSILEDYKPHKFISIDRNIFAKNIRTKMQKEYENLTKK